MKSLWVVNDESNATTGELEYLLGSYDPETKTWQLNDVFGFDLIDLIQKLKWGDPDNGEIPPLSIVTRLY